MSFIGTTEQRNIKTSKGKTFKIFITEQEGGYWVATVLYADDGLIKSKHFSDTTQSEVYRMASEWVINNIDSNAVIDPLNQ